MNIHFEYISKSFSIVAYILYTSYNTIIKIFMPASVSILTSDHPLTTTLYSFDLQPVYFSKFSRSLTVLHKIVSSHYKSVRGGISWIRWIKVVDASLKPMSGVFGGGGWQRGLIAIRDTCPSRKTLRCNKESVVPASG